MDSNGVPNSVVAEFWLMKAIAERWSSRELRDQADVLKGKHLSSTAFRGRVQVMVWEPATGDFAVTGMPLSGNMPKWADVEAREVLDKGEK
jgi:hypothetical protein